MTAYHWLRAFNGITVRKEDHNYLGNTPPLTVMTTASSPQFYLGTGEDVYEHILIPVIEAAEQEVLFVTCFWAQSSVLSKLCNSLLFLSQKSLSRNSPSKIRVRLCFSSRSLLQKLVHTSSPQGYIYPPSTWTTKLGLPPPGQLEGLDLEVKSMFFRPFSVMHPKFVVVDRKNAFMPSCNLSWEKWLECCISLEGPIVAKLVDFWCHSWGREDLPSLELSRRPLQQVTTHRYRSDDDFPGRSNHNFPKSIFHANTYIEAILLPSPYHTSLSLSLPIRTPAPPSTPLNVFLGHAFETAKQSIHMVTPNLTSPPVLRALLAALSRGINITIFTNRLMMIPEQVVTAGTITEICVWKLVRAHRRLLDEAENRVLGAEDTLEAGLLPQRPGRLKVEYFRSRRLSDHNSPIARPGEPVKTHVKCTVIDQETIVLGSGNMDRASWYTSQELGIALFDKELVISIWDLLQQGLQERTTVYYDG